MYNLLLCVYQIFIILFVPFYCLAVFFIYTCKDKNYLANRFAFSDQKREGNKKLIWIHSPGYGESIIASTIIKKFIKASDNIQILATTLDQCYSDAIYQDVRVIHQYIPFDFYFFVNRFLNHWKPDLFILVESDIWPLTAALVYKKVPTLYLNARISDNSFKKWIMFKGIANNVFSKFDMIVAQSYQDKEKFVKLGYKGEIQYIENIKILNESLQKETYKKNPDYIFSVSTHKEDEDVIIPAFKSLKAHYPKLRLIIAPRIIDKLDNIVSLANDNGLTYSKISENPEAIDTDIYIVNKMGLSSRYMKISNITFVGGSFAHGGHNPLEPIYYSSVVIFGTDMRNCNSIASDLLFCDAAIQIRDRYDLESQILSILDKEKNSEEYVSAAKKYILDRQNLVLKEYMKHLQKYLENLY